MKKILTSLLTVLLVVSSVLAFSSCNHIKPIEIKGEAATEAQLTDLAAKLEKATTTKETVSYEFTYEYSKETVYSDRIRGEIDYRNTGIITSSPDALSYKYHANGTFKYTVYTLDEESVRKEKIDESGVVIDYGDSEKQKVFIDLDEKISGTYESGSASYKKQGDLYDSASFAGETPATTPYSMFMKAIRLASGISSMKVYVDGDTYYFTKYESNGKTTIRITFAGDLLDTLEMVTEDPDGMTRTTLTKVKTTTIEEPSDADEYVKPKTDD